MRWTSSLLGRVTAMRVMVDAQPLSRGSTLPLPWARWAISRSRSTAVAAPARSSASRCIRSRSEVSCRSRCFSSGANSKRPASSNDSCSAARLGSSTSAPVSSTSRWKSSTACSESSGSAPSGSSSTGSTSPVWNERPSVSSTQPEALAPLDDDVHPAVLEAVEHLGHGRPRADLAAARRRARRRARTHAPRRGTRRSAPGSGPRRCAAGSARSGAARSRAERGRARSCSKLTSARTRRPGTRAVALGRARETVASTAAWSASGGWR